MHTKIIEIGNNLIPHGSTSYGAALIETYGNRSIIEVFHNPNRDIHYELAHYAIGSGLEDDFVVAVNEPVYNRDFEEGLFSIDDLGAPDYATRTLRYAIEVGIGVRKPREHDIFYNDNVE
jgi:hypothetical protein